jgi:hypothetical protein
MNKFSDYIGLREGVDPDKAAAMAAWSKNRHAKPETNYKALADELDSLFYSALNSLRAVEIGETPTMSYEVLVGKYKSVKARHGV